MYCGCIVHRPIWIRDLFPDNEKKVLIDITYSLVVCISLLYLVYKKFMATIILIQLILVLHIMLLSPVLFL